MGSGNAVIDHLRKWIGDGATEPQLARLAAYGLDAAAGAEEAIRGSQLSEESQKGLLEITGSLRAALTISNLTSAISNFFPRLDSAITTFSILADAVGIPSASQPAEAKQLIDDIERLRANISGSALDPAVKETALQHLGALDSLLRNLDAFGVDAAMAAYTELVLRLSRTSSRASETSVAELAKYWPEIERWAGRLAIIDQAINHGTGLIGHAGKIISMLPKLPSIGG